MDLVVARCNPNPSPRGRGRRRWRHRAACAAPSSGGRGCSKPPRHLDCAGRAGWRGRGGPPGWGVDGVWRDLEDVTEAVARAGRRPPPPACVGRASTPWPAMRPPAGRAIRHAVTRARRAPVPPPPCGHPHRRRRVRARAGDERDGQPTHLLFQTVRVSPPTSPVMQKHAARCSAPLDGRPLPRHDSAGWRQRQLEWRRLREGVVWGTCRPQAAPVAGQSSRLWPPAGQGQSLGSGHRPRQRVMASCRGGRWRGRAGLGHPGHGQRSDGLLPLVPQLAVRHPPVPTPGVWTSPTTLALSPSRRHRSPQKQHMGAPFLLDASPQPPSPASPLHRGRQP